MAGTLPGIPLSQQFSAIGQPLAGCLLYIYAANTTTPQDSFLDQGLLIKNPWPLAGDNSGRVPMFYLADGSVHVRLTDSHGVVQFDYPSMLVIGPSSGTGGPPVSVDPTTVFQTGDVMWLDVPGTRAGWVRDNGKTISAPGGSGSERQSSDCHALFLFLWNTYGNGVCPVIGGRGASAEADWTAPKQITLPDKRGYSPIGDSSMGNFDTVRLGSVPFTGTQGQQGNPVQPGSQCGEPWHTLSTSEMPSHAHPAFINDPSHHHTTSATGTSVSFGGSGGANAPAYGTTNTSDATTGVRVWDGTTNDTTSAVGGGNLHNNTHLCVIGTYFRKL